MFKYSQFMLDNFTARNILLSNPHIAELHIGKSKQFVVDRAKKMKHNAGSYYTEDDFQVVLNTFLKRTDIEKVIEKFLKQRTEVSFPIYCDRAIGRVANIDGRTVKVHRGKVVCRFYGNPLYRNQFTGMPFDIVTSYPMLQGEGDY